jgi:hypothetical protein
MSARLLIIDPDGLVRVSLYFVEANFFDGCIFKAQDSEVFALTSRIRGS